MIIEIKSAPLGQSALEQAVEQLQTYARAGGVKSVLLIDSNDQDLEVKILSLSPLTFTVGIDEVRRLLSSARLLDTLRRERNRFAHSAS
jgi:hypothetical protein